MADARCSGRLGFTARWAELRGFAAKISQTVESDREKIQQPLHTGKCSLGRGREVTPGLTFACRAGRRSAMQSTTPGWIHFAEKEDDNDYHVIIGTSENLADAQMMNVEISGLPPRSSAILLQSVVSNGLSLRKPNSTGLGFIV